MLINGSFEVLPNLTVKCEQKGFAQKLKFIQSSFGVDSLLERKIICE